MKMRSNQTPQTGPIRLGCPAPITPSSYLGQTWGSPNALGLVRQVRLTDATHTETCKTPSALQSSPIHIHVAASMRCPRYNPNCLHFLPLSPSSPRSHHDPNRALFCSNLDVRRWPWSIVGYLLQDADTTTSGGDAGMACHLHCSRLASGLSGKWNRRRGMRR